MKAATASFVANLSMGMEYNTNIAIDELLEIGQTQKEIIFCRMYICKIKRPNRTLLITSVHYNPTYCSML
jgi:hypothetical protein